jgi:cytochrome c-type biogenesis protein CcmH/NrfG
MIATVPSLGDKTEFRSLEERGFLLDVAAVESTTPRQSLRIQDGPEQDEQLAAAVAENVGRPPASDIVLEAMIAAARRDLARYPSSLRARANLGSALLAGHAVGEAIDVLSGARENSPADRPTTALLARALIIGGRSLEAEQLFTRLHSEDPADVVALAGLAEGCMRRGDYAAANRYWRDICDLRPDSSPAHFNRGLTFLLMGPDSSRAALKEMRAAIRIEPRRAAFHHGLGVGYALAKDLDRAVLSFRTALHLEPSNGEALGGLVKVLVDAGRSQEAVVVAAKHVDSIPGSTRPLEILAWAFVTSGNVSAARGELFKAFRLLRQQRPESERDVGRVANNLGVCSALERDWAEALRYFERSV